MSIAVRIRKGQGPYWGTLKRLAVRARQVHIPVLPVTKPLFGLLYRAHVSALAAAEWASRFFWYEPLFRSQCAAVGAGFRMERLPYITGRGRIVLGNNVFLSGKSGIGFSNRLVAEPSLAVGDNTFIGHDCRFAVAEAVTIGRHCLLAGGVSVRDCDGHPLDAARRRAGEPTPPEGVRPVTIGDDVWIGAGATVLKGVTIGDRSVVAAGAVVTKDVPPDSVVAGNPARVVKALAAPAGRLFANPPLRLPI